MSNPDWIEPKGMVLTEYAFKNLTIAQHALRVGQSLHYLNEATETLNRSGASVATNVRLALDALRLASELLANADWELRDHMLGTYTLEQIIQIADDAKWQVRLAPIAGEQ